MRIRRSPSATGPAGRTPARSSHGRRQTGLVVAVDARSLDPLDLRIDEVPEHAVQVPGLGDVVDVELGEVGVTVAVHVEPAVDVARLRLALKWRRRLVPEGHPLLAPGGDVVAGEVADAQALGAAVRSPASGPCPPGSSCRGGHRWRPSRKLPLDDLDRLGTGDGQRDDRHPLDDPASACLVGIDVDRLAHLSPGRRGTRSTARSRRRTSSARSRRTAATTPHGPRAATRTQK